MAPLDLDIGAVDFDDLELPELPSLGLSHSKAFESNTDQLPTLSMPFLNTTPSQLN
jgi:hypothetical protein